MNAQHRTFRSNRCECVVLLLLFSFGEMSPHNNVVDIRTHIHASAHIHKSLQCFGIAVSYCPYVRLAPIRD